MKPQQNAKDLHEFVGNAVFGGAPNPAGIFGPHGSDRGMREELIKGTDKVCSKIAQNNLTDPELEDYLALCNVAHATGTLSESDILAINKIIGRA